MSDVVHPLSPGGGLGEWEAEAGFDWEITSQPALYVDRNGDVLEYPKRRILTRSDDGSPLSIVSDNYKIVQPEIVLSFFKDLVALGGYTLDSAGVMYGGQRFWAIAKTEHFSNIGTMRNRDDLGGYLLLHTSCDARLATQVIFTSIRMSCTNQLPIILRRASWKEQDTGNPRPYISIPHSRQFDTDTVTLQLQALKGSWGDFTDSLGILTDTKVTDQQATQYFTDVFYPDVEKAKEADPNKAGTLLNNALVAYNYAPGQDLPTARGSAWGLVNAVTYLLDHQTRARSNESRLANSWFRNGANTKRRAWENALSLCSNN